MKKVFLFAAAIALTLASCGNKTQGNAAGSDSTATENVDTTAAENDGEETGDAALTEDGKATVTHLTAELQKAIDAKDSKAAITTLANLQTIYKNLVAAGKLDEAKAYGSAIKKFVNDNAESLKNVVEGNVTIANLVQGVQNLPTSASTTAEQAKAAIASDIVNLASPTIAKGETAVATAKAAAEAVKNAPAAAKAAAESKVNSEVQKANAKAEAAKAKNDAKVNEAKQKAAAKVNEAKQKTNEAVNNAANKAIKDLLK